MTYDQAQQENPLISRSEAIKEIMSHHCSVLEFYHDIGKRESYRAMTVLNWLGY